jgi:tetratricopeptide (TPR) repeat protein
LAQCLEELDMAGDAIEHYRELLRLNPNDNQGVRDLLLPALLAAGRDEEAGALLTQYEDDASALWEYGWALWVFRREGDSQAARERLRLALKANRRVPKYLMGQEELPDRNPASYTFGGEEEAVLCADALADVWRKTPGAEAWLGGRAQTKKSGKRRRR